MRIWILLIGLCSLFACGAGADKAAGGESEGMSMGRSICGCYEELASTVRRSKLGGGQNKEDRMEVERQKDSLSRVARDCFREMRTEHNLSSRKDTLGKEERQAIELEISSTLEAECPQVAKLLEEGL